MRRLFLLVLVLVMAVAQIGFWPFVRPLGVVPQALMVVMVLAGLETRIMTGLVLAVMSGLIVDMASGVNFGLWTGALVLVVLVGAMVRQAGIEVERFIVRSSMVLVTTVTMDVAVWVGMARWMGHWPVWHLLGILFGELVINWLVMMALWPLVRWGAAGSAGD